MVLACVGALAPISEARWTEEHFAASTPVLYQLPPGDPAHAPTVIGTLSTYVVESGDTLLDIARYHGLGYAEIVGANPGVDPWLPAVGEVVVLPTEWVLPAMRRPGLAINIPEMRLYHLHKGSADTAHTQMTTFPVGLGRDEWQTPTGPFKIRAKTESPTWVIPESILAERIEKDGDPRRSIPGGAPDNPLGSFRLSLTMPSYALHGTNMPWGVGRQVSHGCIRLYEEDIADLFTEVPIGTPGEFLYEPVKVGMRRGLVYVEAHPDIYKLRGDPETDLAGLIEERGWTDLVDWPLVRKALADQSGLPVLVSRGLDREPPATTQSRSAVPSRTQSQSRPLPQPH